MTGASFHFDFADGWEFVNRASFTDGNADTLGLVPGGGKTWTLARLSK